MKAISTIKRENVDGTIKMFCGACGAEIALEDTGCVCGAPKAMDAGDYYLLPKSEVKPAMLKKAGIETEKSYYSINLSKDDIEKMTDAKTEDDNDPIIVKMKKNGRLQSTWLWRRWVMAQTFYMLGEKLTDWTPTLNRMAYQKTLEHTIQELNVLDAKMRDNDPYLASRSRFFTLDRCKAIFCDYFTKALKEISAIEAINQQIKKPENKRKVRQYKGSKSVDGIFYVWHDALCNYKEIVMNCKDYRELYKSVCGLFKSPWYVKLDWHTEKSPVFIEAFKGAGAYYTMDDMIHGFKVFFEGCNEQQSDKYLQLMTDTANKKNEFYKLHGAMKQFIRDTKFDYGAELDKRHDVED